MKTSTAMALAWALSTASAAMAQPATVTAPVANTGVQPRIFHVFATADGESHFEEITVASSATPLPLTNLRAISYKPNNVTWHNAPAPQFAINLTGHLEVETSDHAKHNIGPGDLVFLEDTKGKGHVTRLLDSVTALFIVPTPGFDIHAWAQGAAKEGG